MDSELQLLSRYHRLGDADAFGSLVRDHAGMVFATAKRITGDAALAEDVAQETFLELARSGQGRVVTVAAWLHRVAWRKACNAIRGESRRRRHEQMAASDQQRAGVEITWEDLEPQIDAAVNDLPAALRTPLVEHYLEGRTQQELAARMGVSQSTVSRQLEVALGELRTRLRCQGVMCSAGLAVLLSSNASAAAPAPLTFALGKLAISGAGSKATAATFSTTTLLTMSTTKILFAAAAVAAISVPIALHQQSSTTAQAAPARPVAREKAAVAVKQPPDAAAPHYRPAPVSSQTRQEVDAIIRRHKGLTKEQLKKSVELNQLMDRFIVVISTPEIQAQVAQRIAAMPTKGRHGTLTMDYDMLDNATGRAWLEAVVANDTQLMRDWVLNTLDGAIFEFAFDPDLERTSNGVRLQTLELAKPEATAQQEDE